jgi:hypothetical protein
LVIFKSGKSLILNITNFFFYNLIPDSLRIDFCVVIFLYPSLFWKLRSCLILFFIKYGPDKNPNSVFTATRNFISLKMIHIKKIWNVYLTYNQFLKYEFGGEAIAPFPLKYDHSSWTDRIRPAKHFTSLLLHNCCTFIRHNLYKVVYLALFSMDRTHI